MQERNHEQNTINQQRFRTAATRIANVIDAQIVNGDYRAGRAEVNALADEEFPNDRITDNNPTYMDAFANVPEALPKYTTITSVSQLNYFYIAKDERSVKRFIARSAFLNHLNTQNSGLSPLEMAEMCANGGCILDDGRVLSASIS